MRILVAVLFIVFWSLPVFASGEKRILFLDGARIEREITARKEFLEVPLPVEMLSGSLRIKALGNTSIRLVEIGPSTTSEKIAEQLRVLKDRRNSLIDRLKNLDDREAIFKSAAKTQSARALRKTKNNPDPLRDLRNGTSYALSQLDEVSSARRSTQKTLSDVETRLATLEHPAALENVARIRLSKPGGMVRIAYLVANLKWKPWYDIRLAGDGYAHVSLCAKMPAGSLGNATSVVPLTLAESFGKEIVPYAISGEITRIADFRFPLTNEVVTKGAVSSLSFAFENSSSRNLPAGEASTYWQEEYIGEANFAGGLPGTSLSLDIGGRQ